MKKGFRWEHVMAVLLCVALLLSALSLPALADEGDFPDGPIVPDPPSQGETSIPDPPPVSDPEPPSEPPVSDVEPPSSEPESSDETSYEPSDEDPEESSESSTTGAAVNPNPTPRRSGGTTLSKPSSSRPTLTLGSPSPAATPADSGSLTPNYITFARLDQKANSMSMTLFYGGAGCVLFGVLGLLLLLVLFIRGRRSRYYDERDGIFEEIAQAENRGSPYASRQTYVPAAPIRPDLQRRKPQSPPPQQPPYYDPVPRQDSLYTEEFDLPAAPPPQDSLYTEEFDLPEPPRRQTYEPPMQDSLYTEEFDLPEPTPATPPRRRPQAQQARNPYDTDEILRELLGKDK